MPRLVNNVWFGSSRSSPQLQMADWIAYAVRTWAESKRVGYDRLRRVLVGSEIIPTVLAAAG